MNPVRTQFPTLPEYLLVIGHSGRMLAEAAVAAGIKPLVVDLFADADTRSLAVEVCKIAELTKECIEFAVDDLRSRHPVGHAVYGSGFEERPECLGLLQERFKVFGNDCSVFVRSQNKREFFASLSQLDIPYPETVFDVPEEDRDWLQKPLRGQGGVGVMHYRDKNSLRPNVYWQRYLLGKSHSVLFLADGAESRIVGFNTQWPLGEGNDREFLFSGIVNRCDLSDEEKSVVTGWIRRCVPVFNLKGLNSLDFIKSGERCYALEINARPPASMPLYDGLLERHILAVQGHLLCQDLEAAVCAGVQMVYAGDDLMIPYDVVWPDGVKDRPDSGLICRKGEPVCSIIAHQADEQQVLGRLEQIRQQIVHNVIRV